MSVTDQNLAEIVQSQYLAALAMLEDTIVNCPTELWEAKIGKNEFWHIAYHAIFYAHLYLMPSEAEFRPWEKHQDESHFLGNVPWPPHDPPKACSPYTKSEVLEYLAFCQGKVKEIISTLDWTASSGFSWYPVGKLEMEMISIRHVQQHAGELAGWLSIQSGAELVWVGAS